MDITNHTIVPSRETYLIAEMSANHCGDMELAKKIIFAAKESGADAVKIQTYTADTLTINCKNDCFKISGGTLWDEKYLYDLYQEAFTPWEWQGELKEFADALGIEFFSTPFDKTAVDFLEGIGVPKYKIASFEAIDIPLIEYTAAKGKPMIISTGICSEEEIGDIISACRKVGNHDITLLKCTSAYPARAEDMNLMTLPDMKKFGVKIGLSDHTMNVETVIAAVALGARVIEKHFTLDRNLGGADAAFSLNPSEFRQMVDSVRLTEQLLGSVDYSVNEKNRRFARSLFICEDIKAGEIFTEKNVRSIRPGLGLPPKFLSQLLGKTARKNFIRGTPISLDDFL
ncbi:MAG: pseudaminic acid synthase [Thermoguttaceae bacterium]